MENFQLIRKYFKWKIYNRVTMIMKKVGSLNVGRRSASE